MNGLRLIEGAKIDKLNQYLDDNFENHIKPYMKKWPYINNDGTNLTLNKKGLLFTDEIITDLFLV